MKLLFLDTETSGLDLKRHDILHVAFIYEEYGNVDTLDHTLVKMRPFHPHTVNMEALEINKITKEDIRSYQFPITAHDEILAFLHRHVDKFDPKDKMYPVAYNGHFDIDFLSKHFTDCKDQYLGSFINWRLIDPLQIVRVLEIAGKIPVLENHKLFTVCNHFKIMLDAHEALSDCLATRALFYRLMDFISFTPKE